MTRKGPIVSAAMTAVVVRKEGEKEATIEGRNGGVLIAGMLIPRKRVIGEKEMTRCGAGRRESILPAMLMAMMVREGTTVGRAPLGECKEMCHHIETGGERVDT